MIFSPVWSGGNGSTFMFNTMVFEKGGLPTLHQKRVAGPGEAVWISCALVHEWGESGEEDHLRDCYSVSSNVDAPSVRCSQGRAECKREAIYLWPQAVCSSRKNANMNTWIQVVEMSFNHWWSLSEIGWWAWSFWVWLLHIKGTSWGWSPAFW